MEEEVGVVESCPWLLFTFFNVELFFLSVIEGFISCAVPVSLPFVPFVFICKWPSVMGLHTMNLRTAL